ncbi:hypothetical protein BB341_20975 [Streptomyces clavuligerus]|uniref:Uncharacterized protein n=2 Tax=Streptomyces clavuligerus TaxID=1901 RepID=E2Q0X1_STRCL|nr:hypothetical protein BB341_20975 [Streptomyces clavuligerus]EFG06514.1 Hypothetical protein SCLAV_1435 [Streptomyces clavuligerus]
MGHSWASGHDLPLSVLLPAFPVTTALAWVAARRRRGPVTIGLGLLAAQGGLHFVFARAQLHGGPPPGAVHHTGPAGAGLPEPGAAAALDAGLLGPSPGAMALAHLLAAAFCAFWLARGETAFLRLAHAVGALAFAPLRAPATAVPLPQDAPRGVPVRHRTRARPRPGALLGHTLVRRGPPGRVPVPAAAPGARL